MQMIWLLLLVGSTNAVPISKVQSLIQLKGGTGGSHHMGIDGLTEMILHTFKSHSDYGHHQPVEYMADKIHGLAKKLENFEPVMMKTSAQRMRKQHSRRQDEPAGSDICENALIPLSSVYQNDAQIANLRSQISTTCSGNGRPFSSTVITQLKNLDLQLSNRISQVQTIPSTEPATPTCDQEYDDKNIEQNPSVGTTDSLLQKAATASCTHTAESTAAECNALKAAQTSLLQTKPSKSMHRYMTKLSEDILNHHHHQAWLNMSADSLESNVCGSQGWKDEQDPSKPDAIKSKIDASNEKEVGDSSYDYFKCVCDPSKQGRCARQSADFTDKFETKVGEATAKGMTDGQADMRTKCKAAGGVFAQTHSKKTRISKKALIKKAKASLRPKRKKSGHSTKAKADDEAVPLLRALNRRCDSGSPAGWLNQYPATIKACMNLILQQPASSCSHTFFHYAVHKDKNCGCVTPTNECSPVNPRVDPDTNTYMIGYPGREKITHPCTMNNPCNEEQAKGFVLHTNATATYSSNKAGSDFSLDSTSAWSPQTNNANQWFQWDLQSVKVVSGVVLQARPVGSDSTVEYVSKFKVTLSLDGTNFVPATTKDTKSAVFTGNAAGGEDKAYSYFHFPTGARFVRIKPEEWVGTISMRSGVLTGAESEAESEGFVPAVTDYTHGGASSTAIGSFAESQVGACRDSQNVEPSRYTKTVSSYDDCLAGCRAVSCKDWQWEYDSKLCVVYSAALSSPPPGWSFYSGSSNRCDPSRTVASHDTWRLFSEASRFDKFDGSCRNSDGVEPARYVKASSSVTECRSTCDALRCTHFQICAPPTSRCAENMCIVYVAGQAASAPAGFGYTAGPATPCSVNHRKTDEYWWKLYRNRGFMTAGGRLGYNPLQSAWVAQNNEVGEWYRWDLGSVKTLGGVVTQGRHKFDSWVTSFSVEVSVDGDVFTPVKSAAGNLGFLGNYQAGDLKKYNLFEFGQRARYVKFVVHTWTNHIAMRMGFLFAEECGYYGSTRPTGGTTQLATVTAETDQACMNACSANGACVSWAYEINSDTCILSSTLPTSTSSDNGWSYGTSCPGYLDNGCVQYDDTDQAKVANGWVSGLPAVAVKTATECSNACTQAADCKNWIFAPKMGGENCWRSKGESTKTDSTADRVFGTRCETLQPCTFNTLPGVVGGGEGNDVGYGNTYGSISLEQCGDRCAANPDCMSVAYDRRGGECWLKDKVVTPKDGWYVKDQWITAYKNCKSGRQDCIQSGKKYEPFDFGPHRRSSERSVYDCQYRCKTTPGCAYFSYWSDGGCHLSAPGAQLRDEGSAKAGPPTCGETHCASEGQDCRCNGNVRYGAEGETAVYRALGPSQYVKCSSEEFGVDPPESRNCTCIDASATTGKSFDWVVAVGKTAWDAYKIDWDFDHKDKNSGQQKKKGTTTADLDKKLGTLPPTPKRTKTKRVASKVGKGLSKLNDRIVQGFEMEFELNVGIVSCSIGFSLLTFDRITASCSLLNMLTTEIVIKPWAGTLTVEVKMCVPVLSDILVALGNIPFVGSFLNGKGIYGGCLRLGYGGYNWHLQRLFIRQESIGFNLLFFGIRIPSSLYFRLKESPMYIASNDHDDFHFWLYDSLSGRAYQNGTHVVVRRWSHLYVGLRIEICFIFFCFSVVDVPIISAFW